MSKYKVSQGVTGFLIDNGGKELRTPLGQVYALPTKALAEAVAREWQSQDGKKINPKTMPLTQFAATAIDIIPKDREKVVGRLAAYGGSDLLCHRAEGPEELVVLQAKVWQPIIGWCEKKYSIKMLVGSGIMPLIQKQETLAVLKKAVDGYDNFWLTGLQSAVDSSGSLLLGLAFAEGHRNAKEVFDAAEIDCSYQISRWGEDPETTARRAGVMQELENAARWLELLG